MFDWRTRLSNVVVFNRQWDSAADTEATCALASPSLRAYSNIHANFPGGEICGFITPEPQSIMMIALGMEGVAVTVV